MKKLVFLFLFLASAVQSNAWSSEIAGDATEDGPCGTFNYFYLNGVYLGSNYEGSPHVGCSGSDVVIHDITSNAPMA